MNTRTIMSVLVVAVLISACGGQTDAPPVPEPVAVEEQPAVEEAAPADQPAPEEPAEQPAQAEPAAEAPQPAAPADESGLMPYDAPEGLFTLEVPGSWSYEKDTEVIDDVVVETYTAPDGHAFVQVVVDEVGLYMDHVVKGEVTVDYMRRLYGSDLRIAEDVYLADERERLTWWSNENGTSGTTFLASAKNYLFFFTTSYEDAYEKDYETILEDVNNSYSVD